MSEMQPLDDGQFDDGIDLSAEPPSLIFDNYNFKGSLPLRPAEDSVGPPDSWKEVGRRVNLKLMQIPLGLMDGVAELCKLPGNVIRGWTRQPPPKQAETVAIAHELAEVREGKKQEDLESGRALSAGEDAVARLQAILRDHAAKGRHVEIRELTADSVVIAVLSPEKRDAIDATLEAAEQDALPASGVTGAGGSPVWNAKLNAVSGIVSSQSSSKVERSDVD